MESIIPKIRQLQIARKKRLALQHARMQKQLQEKMDRDRAEAEKTEAQHDLRASHRERIEAWKSGKKVTCIFLTAGIGCKGEECGGSYVVKGGGGGGAPLGGKVNYGSPRREPNSRL